MWEDDCNELIDRLEKLRAANRQEDALVLLDSEIRHCPELAISCPDLIVLKGRILLDLKEYEQVEYLARSLISGSPELWSKGWLYLAEAQYWTKRYDEAIVSYQKALDLTDLDAEPEKFRLYVDIAFCYHWKEDYPNALIYLNRYVERNEPDAETWRLFGKIYIEMEQFDRAEESLRKSLALEPDNDDTCYHLGRVLKGKDAYPEALEFFQRALAFRQDGSREQVMILDEIAFCLYVLQDYESSRHYLEMAVQIDPGNMMIHILMAKVQAEMKELLEAESHFQFVLSCQHPEQPDLFELEQEIVYHHYGLFLAKHGEGRTQEAVQAFERTLAINPRQPDILCSYGELMLKTGDQEWAIRQFSKAAELGDERAKEILKDLEDETD